MKQKYLFLFLLMGLKIFSQTNSFVASTCIGTTTGSQARMYAPVVADFDGDSDKDIIVCDESGVYYKFTNNGSNVFTSTTIFPGLSAYTAITGKDMDNDGDIDVVSVTGKVFINNGSGTFTQLAGTFFTATGSIGNFKIADFNGDGKQDILWLNATQNSSTNKNQVWINNGTTGSANFVLASEFDTLGIYNNGGAVVGDIDNDNDIDLVNCGQGGWNGKVYKNNGSGTFTESQLLPTYTGNGFLADWDKDGDTDFLAYDYYNNFGLRLWKNDGTGTFGAVSASSLITVLANYNVYQIADLNGDTWLDLVSGSIGGGARYYLNSGCQLTLNPQVLSNAYNGIVVTDFNNDAKPDLFCAARDAQSCIHINDLDVMPYVPITAPTATTQINYTVGQTASPLTASGSNLLWYTAATGGTGSATAPTPSTAAVGTTSYWVSSTNSNGCESNRIQINVTVALPATHLNFDGSNDFVSCGNILPSSYTKEAWVYITNASLKNNFISGGDLDGQHAFWAPDNNGNRLASGHNATWNHVQDPTPLNLNTWYHVAVTYDAATSTMKLYKNGILVSTNTSVPAFINGNTVRLGAFNNANNLLMGNLDEVRIWNVARTAEQINGSKNCELQGTESGLLAYYKFNQGDDQGTNTSITSLTATTGSNGTLTNFALTGATSNWLAGSPVTTGSIIPGNATVTTPVIYAQGATPSALTATTGSNGTGLLWYTAATGGTGSTTAPTPSTATLGSTTYYVSSTNANGCESARTPIVVNVNGPATHLNFDGTNDHVLIPAAAINNLPQGSIEAWIRPTASVLDNQTICAKQSNNENSYAIFSIGGDTAANGKLFYKSKNGSTIISASSIVANQWTHVAVTFTGTQAQIYINGVLDATASGDFSLPNDLTVTATSIGAWLGDGNGQYFQGDIDEFRVWNAVLTPADITNTMNCELQASQTNIVTYYKFNQGFDNTLNSSVTTASDVSGNTNDGTLTNFALTGTTSNWKSGSAITSGNTCAALNSNSYELESNLSIYPNPAQNEVTIHLETFTNSKLEVFDLNGRLLMKQNLTSNINRINIEELNSGIYLFTISSDSSSSTKKIIKN